jgi:hypothetical protein
MKLHGYGMQPQDKINWSYGIRVVSVVEYIRQMGSGL